MTKTTLINCLTTLSLIPILVMGQGVDLLSKEDYLKIKSPSLSAGQVDIPTSYTIGNLPTPNSQGEQSSCTGWATGYAFMSFYIALKNNSNISQTGFFSPSYVYNNLKPCSSCNCGISIPDALNFLISNGNVKLEDYPFVENNCSKPSSSLKIIAANYKIKGYYRVDDILNFTEFKQYLSQDIPIIIAAKTDNNFQDFDNKTNDDIFFWQNPINYNRHAMLIVGYDENKQAFKLMNSWGANWGNRGFAWVDYKTFRYMLLEAYVVTKDYNMQDVVIENNSTTVTTENFQPYGYNEDLGNNRYYYTYGLKIDESVKGQINKVVYFFNHPSFTNKYFTSSKSPYFKVSYNGYGCLNEVKAIIYLTNGNQLEVNFNGCNVLDNSNSSNLSAFNITPSVTAEPTSEENRYNFVIKLRGIESIKDRILKVVYDRNHPSFPQRYVTTYDKDNNFEGGYEGWGCLRNLNVIIYFDDGTIKTIPINMCNKLGWEN